MTDKEKLDKALALLDDIYDTFGVWAVAAPDMCDGHDVMCLEDTRKFLDEHLPDSGRVVCPSIRARVVIGIPPKQAQ